MDTIRIFDTSLRDGEQAPGFSMTEAGKLRMAHALAALNVDIIEAGFAGASPGEVRSIAAIARDVRGPVIASLARATTDDIDAAGDAIAAAPARRIHVFLGTSPLHREFKLKMTKDAILTRIREAVVYARRYTDDIEFSAEDAIRTERDFLVEALSVAAQAGATTLNVPDTVGYTTPDEIEALFRHLSDEVDRPDGVVFSTHCHDDLGMAVANSLAAVRGGARQIECAVNGIGERAGNCALEEVVMALKTRADHFGLSTRIDTREILNTSNALAQVTNTPPPRNKAIVGANAFAHESGIHQHGILQNRETYEIMRPEDIGLSTDGIVLGKHSGRHALVARARALGHDIDGPALDTLFAEFKRVADEVGTVDTARLLSLLSAQATGRAYRLWTVRDIDIRAAHSPDEQPEARVTLDHGELGAVVATARAPGEMDAAFAACADAMGIPATVAQLDMQYIAAERGMGGNDAQAANVLVEMVVDVRGERFTGRARARDIVPCCVAAFVDAASNAEAITSIEAALPA